MIFEEFDNVRITGVDLSVLSEEQREVLYHQAKYCQAMTDADTDTMRKMVPEDVIFTHMSGKKQTN